MLYLAFLFSPSSNKQKVYSKTQVWGIIWKPLLVSPWETKNNFMYLLIIVLQCNNNPNICSYHIWNTFNPSCTCFTKGKEESWWNPSLHAVHHLNLTPGALSNHKIEVEIVKRERKRSIKSRSLEKEPETSLVIKGYSYFVTQLFCFNIACWFIQINYLPVCNLEYLFWVQSIKLFMVYNLSTILIPMWYLQIVKQIMEV